MVFMAIQILFVDDLADFFGDYFYILIPLCYFYAYRQLFGYGFWGNFWRVVLMLGSGLFLAVMTMSIAEVLTTMHKPHVNEYKAIVQSIPYWALPLLVGMFISKKTYKKREINGEIQP